MDAVSPGQQRRETIRLQKWSDLQDFGDCIQSSQIGPHLVQPFRTRPMAIIPLMIVNRLNMNAPTQHRSPYPANQGVFKPARRGRCRGNPYLIGWEPLPLIV
jgi:hypothetical protein